MEEKDFSVFDFLQYVADSVFRDFSMLSIEKGKFRGGACVGFKDELGRIFKIETEINPEFPAQWGEDHHYTAYAALKVSTALETERDTWNLPKKVLPLKAVDKGAVVVFSRSWKLWFSIGYSGLTGNEDRELSSKLVDKYLSWGYI